MNTDRLLKSGNWVRDELLVRLAHRIRDFQQLPFFVGTNPHIEYVYKLYWGAFKSIRAFPAIKTHEDNLEFCQLLQNLLEDGLLVLPRLAQGIGESARFYQNPEQKDLDLFLNRILRSYVSRRVIAEQHLALTEACEHQWDLHTGFGDGYVGIIFVHCSASDILKRAQQLVFQNVHRYHTGDNVCQMIPPKIDVAIQNNTPINESQNGEILFAYVPEQLERILYELLDNAVRFTMLKHPDGNYPPIKVTVSANESDVYFRVSDQGGGISSQRFEQLWSYQSRSQMGEFNEMKQVSKVPVAIDDRVSQASEMGHRHLGLGLTMSRIYAEYWGGELQVIPMDGFGTDAYVRIPRLGTNAENLGISHQSEHPDFYDNVKSKYTIYNSSKVPKQHNKKRPLATSEKSKHSNAASISTLPKQQHLYNNMLTHSYNGNGWSESRMIRS
ncbi:hypothetical protein BDF20DRAFT_821295 [Mycotypha africana]|uniref:uncharacterized protein n=1 Tax=Mycotypha africana TaxID=64632 RepID=UPI002301E164|nr:uncharacterized protein BDF20DRAFT_821295 [Mycotypha africana]KAI8977277.1 hypothetical protein BDF20DRAFT_821295 [Mycotypha africana]